MPGIFGSWVPTEGAVVPPEVVPALEEALAKAPIVHRYLNGDRGGGAGRSVVAVLFGGICVIMKLEDEADDGRTMVNNERAAWVFACQIGLGHLLAVTVLRDVPSLKDPSREVRASLQVAWPNCEAPPEAEPPQRVDQDQLLCSATFDYVVGATDRRSNNWLTLNGSARCN